MYKMIKQWQITICLIISFENNCWAATHHMVYSPPSHMHCSHFLPGGAQVVLDISTKSVTSDCTGLCRCKSNAGNSPVNSQVVTGVVSHMCCLLNVGMSPEPIHMVPFDFKILQETIQVELVSKTFKVLCFFCYSEMDVLNWVSRIA